MAAHPNLPGEFSSSPITVPIIAEQLVVDRERIETGRVRISKRVREEIQTVEVPVIHEEVDVERVAFNCPIDALPPVRHEGNTMVISVVREEVVVEKRLVLVEEIRITRKTTETIQSREVTLRREELVVDRQSSGPDVQG